MDVVCGYTPTTAPGRFRGRVTRLTSRKPLSDLSISHSGVELACDFLPLMYDKVNRASTPHCAYFPISHSQEVCHYVLFLCPGVKQNHHLLSYYGLSVHIWYNFHFVLEVICWGLDRVQSVLLFSGQSFRSRWQTGLSFCFFFLLLLLALCSERWEPGVARWKSVYEVWCFGVDWDNFRANKMKIFHQQRVGRRVQCDYYASATNLSLGRVYS